MNSKKKNSSTKEIVIWDRNNQKKIRSRKQNKSRPASNGNVSSNANRRSGQKSGGSAVAAAYSKSFSGSLAQQSFTKEGRIIKHKELLASITGSTAFTVPTMIALNPGISASFPWLSTQAAGYEEYKFKKLCFHYLTRTGSTTPGSIMLVPDYDALDPAPTSEQIASVFQDTKESVPWNEIFSCPLNVNAMFQGNRKFIRTGAVANSDLKTYDAGNLFVCTMDGTAVNWGKLWVEYEVELFVPQLPSSGGSQTAALAGLTNLAQATPFGTAPVITNSTEIALTVAGNVLTISGMQIGSEYLLSVLIVGTVLNAIALTVSAGLTSKSGSSIVNAAATNIYYVHSFTSVTNSGTLTFNDTATTITSSNLFYGRVPTNSF